MPHLWIEQDQDDWAVFPLTSARVPIDSVLAAASGRASPESVPVTFVRDPEQPRGSWHLLAGSNVGVWVNGIRLVAGLRVLGDRDQIRIGDRASLFFSTESLARVDEMPPGDKPMMCPRCRQQIAQGSPAVRCPQCALWHHETTDLPCWTYSPACTLCPQPTALDAGFQWTPLDL